jgi:hypothetical protein
MLTSSEIETLKAVATNTPAMTAAKTAIRLRATVGYDVMGEIFDAFYSEKPGGEPEFTFGWRIYGENIYDLHQTLKKIYDPWEEGLKSIRSYHRWQIFMGTEPDWTRRVSNLAAIAEKTDNPGAQQFAIDAIARTQEISRLGDRADVYVDFYVTYDPEKDTFSGEEDDMIEVITREVKNSTLGALSSVSKFFKIDIGGSREREEAERIENLFKRAQARTYTQMKVIFSAVMNLDARPLSAGEMWRKLRSRFSGHDAGESTYHIECKIDKMGVNFNVERYLEDWHIADYLLKDGVPDLYPSAIKLKRWNPEKIVWNPDKFNSEIRRMGVHEVGGFEEDYIGILVARAKPNTMLHEYAQLHHWHKELLANPDISGVEICIQFTASDSKTQQKNAQDIYKQALKRQREAARIGEYSASGTAEAKQAVEAMDSMHADGSNVWLSFVMIVHRPSVEQLDLACADLEQRFKVCHISREYTVASHIWLRTMPCSTGLMTRFVVAGVPVNCSRLCSTKEAMTYMPFARTIGFGHTTGIELVSEDGHPVLLDLFSHAATYHFAVIAKQRYGKSYFAQMISAYYTMFGNPTTWLDQPPPDGRSAIRHQCKAMGGSYIEIKDKDIAVNILGLPSALLKEDSPFTPKQRNAQLNGTKEYWLEILMILAGPPPDEDEMLYTTSRSLFQLGIESFLTHPRIMQKYERAIKGGIGSSAWDETPSLPDFAEFMTKASLQSRVKDIRGPVEAALDYINLKLPVLCSLNSPVGNTIARPSTVDIENSLLTAFSLEGVSPSSPEGLAYCLVAYVNANQKALTHLKSLIVFEELQDLVKHPGILHAVADCVTRGGKHGMTAGLVTNSFGDVADSPAGKRILANLTTKIVGGISSPTVEPLAQHLRLPEEYLEPCTRFTTNLKKGATKWFVYHEGTSLYGTYYSPWTMATVSASNAVERAVLSFFYEVADSMDIEDAPQIAVAAATRFFRACAEQGRMIYEISKDDIRRLIDQVFELCAD